VRLAAHAGFGRRSGETHRWQHRQGTPDRPHRTWVRQAETDEGTRPGMSSVDAARIAALERENRELRRANQILKSAASFFAAELDRPAR
jgi:transposase